MDDKKEIKLTSAEGPHCPKCGDRDLARQLISVSDLMCDNCKFHFTIKQPIDFEQFFKSATQFSAKVEEEKYLKLLRWFKLFYDFYQKDISSKPSACASALAEDGELQEFIREADRIG